MKVLLFARLKDLVGTDHVDVHGATSVGDLRRSIMQQHPQAAGLLAKSAFAVNGEFADDAMQIPDGAEVALLPPVSGG